MQKISNIEVIKKSLLVVVALGLVLFMGTVQFASAEEEGTDDATAEVAEDIAEEEDVDEDEEGDDLDAKKAAMKAQIESLRKMIEERKAQLKENRQVVKEEQKEARMMDRAEFMASLEGLTLEEKKVAILEYIANLKATIEAKKAEAKQAAEMQKEVRIEDREAFRASLEGMTPAEKYAAIMERVAALKASLAARMAEDEDEDEDEVEDEDEDESDDEDEDEDESNS